MQTCLHCGKGNPEEEAYCYSCGHILPSALPAIASATLQLDEIIESLEPRRRWGTAYFDRQSHLQFTFRDSGEVMEVAVNGDLVIGRAHREPNIPQPDVDLGPYGAHEKGVSRCHLLVSYDHDTLMIADLGSSNHTYLNGQLLLANEPRILRDNDELRLGHLVIRVRFI